MTVIVRYANQTGFVPVYGDKNTEGIDDLSIPTVYEGSAFSIDIEFIGLEPDPIDPLLTVEVPATDVTTTFDFDQYNMTATKVNDNTYRIAGPCVNAFPSAKYEFTMPDKSVRVMAPNTTEPFLSLSHYTMPTNTTIQLFYEFTVSLAGNPLAIPPVEPYTETVTIDQWVHWVFGTAAANVQAIVARGLK